jgi:hypothetical protein
VNGGGWKRWRGIIDRWAWDARDGSCKISPLFRSLITADSNASSHNSSTQHHSLRRDIFSLPSSFPRIPAVGSLRLLPLSRLHHAVRVHGLARILFVGSAVLEAVHGLNIFIRRIRFRRQSQKNFGDVEENAGGVGGGTA